MLAPAGKRKHTSILPLLAIVVLVSTSRALSILLHTGVFLPAALLGFLWLLFSLGASALHRDVKLTPQEERSLDDKRVNVVIPLKNEDPEAFRQLLESISKQSRLPQKVHVVDNGSNNDDCHRVFLTWGRNRPISIEAVYDTTGPIGKRGAQALAFDADLEADYFVTVDSDTILDVHSIARGIAPFFKPEITSVAGLLLTLNGQKNLLTRLVDLSFTTSFLNGRASWSRLGSVVVNCGGLAFYRATVVRKYQDEYVNQKVLGRRVSSGDDRMLTCYALLEGKTVIQESSIAYTLMPENISHLTRQRVRWWRSFFWGGVLAPACLSA